jgi:hypothetical protein
MKPYIEAWKEARALREQTHPDDPNGGTFKWEGDPNTTFSTKSPTAHLEDYVLKPAKQYWLREEIPIADELMSYAPALTEEFLDYHDTFTDSSLPADLTKLTPYNKAISASRGGSFVQSRQDAWLVDNLKYTDKDGARHDDFARPEIRNRFPTACKITERFGDQCPSSTYSILNANSVIKRHTGIENRNAEFIRIHVPLIIPEGDIFFECEGVEIDWSDLWGFDNQLTHSAHNYTPHRRLIYMIDIRRSYLGLPNGEPYDGIRVIRVPPFVRGKLPKMLHEHQRV